MIGYTDQSFCSTSADHPHQPYRRPPSRFQHALGQAAFSTLALAEGRPYPRGTCLIGGGPGAFVRRL